MCSNAGKGMDAKIPCLKQEVFLHYSAFKQRIKELEATIGLEPHQDPKPLIYIIFSGSYASGLTGKSWCGLCNAVFDFVNQEIVWSYKKTGYLLWARVGDQDEWADPDNPFKKDPQIRIKSVPAAMIWGTEKKLQGFSMARGPLIKELFGLENENK